MIDILLQTMQQSWRFRFKLVLLPKKITSANNTLPHLSRITIPPPMIPGLPKAVPSMFSFQSTLGGFVHLTGCRIQSLRWNGKKELAKKKPDHLKKLPVDPR